MDLCEVDLQFGKPRRHVRHVGRCGLCILVRVLLHGRHRVLLATRAFRPQVDGLRGLQKLRRRGHPLLQHLRLLQALQRDLEQRHSHRFVLRILRQQRLLGRVLGLDADPRRLRGDGRNEGLVVQRRLPSVVRRRLPHHRLGRHRDGQDLHRQHGRLLVQAGGGLVRRRLVGLLCRRSPPGRSVLPILRPRPDGPRLPGHAEDHVALLHRGRDNRGLVHLLVRCHRRLRHLLPRVLRERRRVRLQRWPPQGRFGPLPDGLEPLRTYQQQERRLRLRRLGIGPPDQPRPRGVRQLHHDHGLDVDARLHLHLLGEARVARVRRLVEACGR
mmetsp:Transcript_77651/g.251266  ORF Transcript_77651/g.251266 Transcript_77651/m.251266 type:complete len:328 (-) Transcript_77651:1162-2145(-)